MFGSVQEGSPLAVGLGLENSDLLVRAFQGCKNLPEAADRLRTVLGETLVPLDSLAKGIVEGMEASYK